MKITLFSSNQPRHIALASALATVSDQLYFIQECNTVFPGRIEGFFKKSPVMQDYFCRVMESEKKLFNRIAFSSDGVKTLSISMGDLSNLDEEQLGSALDSDLYIVFGSSFIKGWLVDYLVNRNAINIHMGISPYYRGSSCNFWALYDNNPNYVGATIHKLSKGLDSGDMLFHCLPKLEKEYSWFDFTMSSVLVAQKALVSNIKNRSLFEFTAVKQDNSKEVRYSRNRDFTDKEASEFLARNNLPRIELNSYPDLLNPYFG